jgi:hypothetical protein
MLQKTEENVAYCYQRAEEARRMANRASDPVRKKEHQRQERRWLVHAESCDITNHNHVALAPARFIATPESAS